MEIEMLTAAQQLQLRDHVVADPALNVLYVEGNLSGLADSLNAFATPDFMLWNSATPVKQVFDAVDRSKYTPTDAADVNVIFTNRCLAAQTKMMALDGMLIGRDTLDCTKATIRSSLRDAVIQLPTGAAGALVSAAGVGGVNVLNACLRKATVLEKLLVVGTATTGTVTAALPGFEGAISYDQLIGL